MNADLGACVLIKNSKGIAPYILIDGFRILRDDFKRYEY